MANATALAFIVYSMKYKDYYATLGVNKDATLEEIKKSYRKLAHQYHPDVSSDPKGEEKFKEIAEAYSTLKDPEKRAAYDELGNHAQGQNFSPPPDWGNQHGAQAYSFDDIDLADLFAGFASGHKQTRPMAGQDYQLTTQISLDDAYTGSSIDLNFTLQEHDTQGQLTRVPHQLKVRIPKGIVDGQKLLLRGKGDKGLHGAQDGNIYLTIHLLAHPLFNVKKHDLFITLPLTPWEAGLGATVKVPTLAGAVNLKIPAGTPNEQKFRIAKRGMPSKNDEHGDLFAIVKIVLPEKPSPEELDLLKEWSKISTFNPRPHFE